MANKKRLSLAVGIGALSLFVAAVLWAAKGQEHKSSEECCSKGQGKHHMMCPIKIDGAEVKVVNTDNGVTIHITAEDSKVVKDIQTATANMVEKGCCPKHLGKAHKGKDRKEKPKKGCKCKQ